jgi:hypothetical protein
MSPSALPTPEPGHPHLKQLIGHFPRERDLGRRTQEIVKDPYVQEFDPDSIDEALKQVDRAMALRAL